MQAIEFDTISKEGVVTPPKEHLDYFDKPVRFFLLPAPQAVARHPSKEEIQAFFTDKKLNLQDYQWAREEANVR